MEKSILIIDDEEILRISLSQYLEDFGYKITAAESGFVAMDILSQENDIDLVIADLRMPGMSGDEFIIKAHEKFPDLKYIIQTGTIDYVPDQRLLDAGVTSEYVLAKPVLRLHTYVDLIENILSRQ